MFNNIPIIEKSKEEHDGFIFFSPLVSKNGGVIRAWFLVFDF
jgi:hypothetical protein